MSEQESNDRVIATRWLDADGEVVENIGGVWCHPEDGSRANPVERQVIRESAWESPGVVR